MVLGVHYIIANSSAPGSLTLVSYSLNVLAQMALYLNIFVADILDCSCRLYIWHLNHRSPLVGFYETYYHFRV